MLTVPVIFSNCPRTVETIMWRTLNIAALWDGSISHSLARTGPLAARVRVKTSRDFVAADIGFSFPRQYALLAIVHKRVSCWRLGLHPGADRAKEEGMLRVLFVGNVLDLARVVAVSGHALVGIAEQRGR